MAKKNDMADLIEALAGDISPGADLRDAVALLKKRVLERALEAEMEEQLGYEKHARQVNNGGIAQMRKPRKR